MWSKSDALFQNAQFNHFYVRKQNFSNLFLLIDHFIDCACDRTGSVGRSCSETGVQTFIIMYNVFVFFYKD